MTGIPPKPTLVGWKRAASYYARRRLYWQHSHTGELLEVAGIMHWGGHNLRVSLANGREFVVDDRSKFWAYRKGDE